MIEELSLILSQITADVQITKIPIEEEERPKELSKSEDSSKCNLERQELVNQTNVEQKLNSVSIDEQLDINKKRTKKKVGNKMRKIKTIYEVLSSVTDDKQKINDIINSLRDDEKELIKKKYGDDLDNPTTSPDWTKEDSVRFNRNLLIKMKKMITNPNYKPRKKKGANLNENVSDKDNTTNTNSSTPSTKTSDNTLNDVTASNVAVEKLITNEEYIKTLEFFNNPLFANILKDLNLKEQFIAVLVLGQLDNENPKYYSTEAIAEFLAISVEEVRNIMNKVLNTYKNAIAQYVDETIDMISSQKKLGTK